MTLMEKLGKLSDGRVFGRIEHRINVLLMIDIMGKVCGYNGIMAKAEFMKTHKKILKKLIKIKTFPSYNTISRAKEKIDFEELNQILLEHFSAKNPDTNVIHLDGKAIKSSVKDKDGKQTFEAIVTAFTGELALSSIRYNNGKESEIQVFQKMITNLGLNDVIFTGDALHCQKKQ